MDNVVYILGAGFSAPLRLPVVSNFLERAKDLYQSNTVKYQHFEQVFEGIKKMGYVPLYYRSDLTNIEEVLSILEMERLCGNVSKEETDNFIRFIKDVIEGFTPFVTEYATIYNYKWIDKGIYRSRGATHDWTVEDGCYPETDDPDENWHAYGNFVLRLFHAKLKAVAVEGQYPNIHRLDEDVPYEHEPTDFEVFCQFDTNPSTNYSVITLNYDMVLENFAEHFSSLTSGEELKFSRPGTGLSEGSPMLVKLHGSVHDGTVIPPTWNKSLHPKIEQEWKQAYKLLSSANHICILGYSLPENDAYVRYLLKSSLLETGNLKTIDVVCVDNDGTVSKRYDSFILLKQPKFRFINAKVQAFLPFIHSYPTMDSMI